MDSVIFRRVRQIIFARSMSEALLQEEGFSFVGAVTLLVISIFLPNITIAQTLFESQKLEAIRFQVASSADKKPVREVFSVRVQCAAGNSEVLHSGLPGTPLLLLSAIFQYSSSMLLTLTKAENETPPCLVGRRVMGGANQSNADFSDVHSRANGSA
jgi:hypothetical protein